ncbi:MAG: hypothetical protein M1831_005825 [Alyxoria varia]|nr:MAG: hypothetical protein M1831_005825 [Alyxoria varia]
MEPSIASSGRKSKSHRKKTSSLSRIRVMINVYDLLPPGKVSTVLWHVGGSLLHSGVVIEDKEYAYGGHDKRGVSGVYWTRPRQEPPGGTFKCEILHGFALISHNEIESVIREASHRFLGPSWNLLHNNCNHFCSYVCEQLTGRPAPAWLNRAAKVGVALPCLVPQSLLAPPDVETADGELIEDGEEEDETDDDDYDEQTAMLRSRPRAIDQEEDESSGESHSRVRSRSRQGKARSGRTRTR